MDGCNENVIEFMTNDTRATLSFSQGRYKSVIRKLAEKHPDDCQIVADNEDGNAMQMFMDTNEKHWHYSDLHYRHAEDIHFSNRMEN